MSRIFLSHSSLDWRHAVALKQWLAEQDHSLASEIFLDIDPDSGIPTGARWREALQAASSRCEAVICLLSANWSNSKECRLEYDTAVELHKQLFCARLEPSSGDDLTSQWQRCDLFGKNPTTSVDIGDGGPPVAFSSDGLYRLLKGIRGAGISADSFRWPPKDDPGRAPYRGWEPLAEVDAAVFFGRDAEIVLGLDALRGMRSGGVKSLFVVLGPSGAGKSSFLRAGLLPRLRRDDRRFLPLEIVRPERAALTGKFGLAQSIYTTRLGLGLNQPPLDEITTACTTASARVCELLLECQRAAQTRLIDSDADEPPPSLVLPVDQTEELFTADAGPEASEFLSMFKSLAITPGLGLIVAATIRTDRYEAMQTAPELADLQTVTFNDLKPMPANHFKDVITGPADRATQAGHRLHLDPDLIAQLLADCTEGADTLPILSLTLARLYAEHGSTGRLTMAHYRAMGGMKHVVQTEIDDILSADSTERRNQLDWLRAAFIPWLATINPDNDQPMRRFARYCDLPEQSRPLIDALVAKRLMVKDIHGEGDAVVEVALESLLRQWNELDGWLRDQRHNLKAADDLERSANNWRANDNNAAWLLEGSRLADAAILVNSTGFRQRLTSVHDYLTASQLRENARRANEEQQRQAELQAAEERARNAQERQATAEAHTATLRRRSQILRRVLTATAVVAIIAIIGGITAVVGFRQASSARDDAEAKFRQATSLRLVSEAQSMLAGTRPGGDARAFQQLLAAYALTPTPDRGTVFSAVVAKVSTRKIIETPTGVNSVEFSPRNDLFASGGTDGVVRFWDVDTGQPVGEPIAAHTDAVRAVAFSPDGHTIATASNDRTVRLWNVDTRQPVGEPIIGHTDEVRAVAFSPDGHTIATASIDGTARLWNLDTRRLIGPPLVGHTNAVTSVTFSPDGRTIATASADHTVRLWNAETHRPVGEPITGHTDTVWDVAFSPDGHTIATASDNADGTVRLVNADTREFKGMFTGHTDSVSSIAFSPDSRTVATAGTDNTVWLVNSDDGLPIDRPLTGHTDAVFGVAISPDGHTIASASADHTVRLWNPEIGRPLTGEHGLVWNVAYSPNGQLIATTNADGTLLLWNPDTRRPIGPPLVGHTGAVVGLAFSPDGTTIATGGADHTLRLWDANRRAPIGEPLVGHTGAVTSVAFSPDARKIATAGDDGTVRLWDAATRRPIGEPLTGHSGAVSSVAFSPDGTIIATAGDDHTVRLWDTDTRQPIGDPLTGHTNSVFGLAFSPDGTTIATASADDTLRLWDTDSRKPIGDPLTGHTDAVFGVAFSPDGTTIATASADHTVRLWDKDTRRPIGEPLTGHTARVWRVAFSPDGHTIASGSFDDSVRIWPADATPEMLCDKLTANMSHKQWNEWVTPDIDYVQVCPDLPVPPD
jgi:WD40 repeat protein